MGYLTTFTIYNDGIDTIKKNSVEFCNKLHYAVVSGSDQTFGHDYFCNLVNVQKTRHADDHAMYIHMGNCVTRLNAFDRETEELMRRNPKFFKELLTFARNEVKTLEDKFKKISV